MNNKILIVSAAAFLICGCAATAPKTVVYTLEADSFDGLTNEPALASELLVENFTVRDAYKNKSLMASPKAFELTKRANAEWAESAGALLNSAVRDYLAPRCTKILPPEWKSRVPYDASLIVHLDALTQCKRGDNWFAVLRLSYEVLPKGGGKPIVSGRYDKAQPLADGDLENYVAAQSGLVIEWLNGLLAELRSL